MSRQHKEVVRPLQARRGDRLRLLESQKPSRASPGRPLVKQQLFLAGAGGELVEVQLAIANGDFDRLAWLDVAAEDFLGERILQIFLHRATQGTRAKLRIVPLLDQKVGRGCREADLNVLVLETALDL